MIRRLQQSCGDVSRTSFSLLFLVRYDFTTNLDSWGRFGLTGHAEDYVALAGREQGNRLLMKGTSSVFLGFRLNPRGECILLTRFHKSQEPGGTSRSANSKPFHRQGCCCVHVWGGSSPSLHSV